MSDRKFEFKLRSLRVEDSQAIFSLKQQSTRVLNSPDYTPEQIEALCGGKEREFKLDELKITDSVALFLANFTSQNRNNNNYSSMVAYLGDKIIGYAFLQIDNLSWVNNGTLFELFVHPEYSRRGVGIKLLETMEAYAKQCNGKIISVGASLSAIPFYKICGYQVLNKGSYLCHGVSIPIVFMEKWLVKPTEMEKTYWKAAEEFNRKTSWLFTATSGLSREIFS